MLENSQGLRHLAPFVRHHHERCDGQGYPDGLAGEDIPLEARILNVCDAVEAMAADRAYHGGLALPEILAELRGNAGTQFDPQIAEVLIRIAERQGATMIVNSARGCRAARAQSRDGARARRAARFARRLLDRLTRVLRAYAVE